MSTKYYSELHFQSWNEFKHHTSEMLLGKNWIYRGHADSNWKFENSLVRDEFIHQEKTMRDQFQEAASLFIDASIIPKTEDVFGWLSLMQHHGVPTRLLDFTYSPYIASYFAFEHNFEKGKVENIAIWAVDIKNILTAAKEYLKDEKNIPDIHELENLDFTSNKFDMAIPIKPLRDHIRSFSQLSVFLCSCNSEKSLLKQIKKKSSDDIIKITIPYSERRNALFDLNRMRINSSTLFPDLDGFSKSIKIANELNMFIYDTACYFDDKGTDKMLKDFEWLFKKT